ncbi:glycerophosphodiester phosphodiesterase family protein [Vibrio hannami]|uniref:glycerophosphodiester phosphodiesterase family protein n=1 Tax=Vibrio hannami TaxID=2717094 RepID=UPI0024100AAF|nr:glycerophosphodiester phosphodiesterase family protein [Vibrio hannami]MDG3088037.1 glycerophosphodiester phosphodiesterase family protein [Vibrio hannami]
MKPIIIGHRGIAGRYPENTKASLEAAIREGIRWVEVDIQPTKDGRLVVCHDHTIDRCSNGTGRVDHHSLEELQSFDFGSWFAPEFKGEKILTLEELLAISKKHNLRLNLEIKLDTDCAEPVVTELARLLDISQIDYETVVLSSFAPSVIKVLASKCPEYNLGVITDKLSTEDIELIRETGANNCHINYQTTTAHEISLLRKMSCQIWCFTVNEPEKFALLREVDAIFSDYPERF